MNLDPQEIDDSPYNITITCEVYRNDHDIVIRGLVFKVMKAVRQSALMETLADMVGNYWEVVREPEVSINRPFGEFEKKIQEMWRGEPILTKASFLIRYHPYENQVGQKYMLENGFSADNVPWSELAKYHTHAKPIDRTEYVKKYGEPTKTGFSEYAYRGEQDDTNLDPGQVEKFSPEEQKAAEDQVQRLKDRKLVD